MGNLTARLLSENFEEALEQAHQTSARFAMAAAIRELHARLATAKADLAAVREDVARLTWISANLNRDAHGKDVPFIVSTVMQDVLLHCPPMGSKYPHLRAAIDSACAGGGR